MTFATTLAVLMLGGGVLPAGDEPAPQQYGTRIAAPSQDATNRPASRYRAPVPRTTSPGALPASPAAVPQYGTDGSRHQSAQPGTLPGLGAAPGLGSTAGGVTAPGYQPSSPGAGYGQSGRTADLSHTQRYRQTQMPISPTDPVLADPSSPWAAPTTPRDSQLPSFGTRYQAPFSYGGNNSYRGRYASPGGAGYGGSPGYSSGSARLYYDNSGSGLSRSAALDAQADRMATQGMAPMAPSTVGPGAKPFSGVDVTNRPAVSPYALLGNNSYNTEVDVYNQIVAPRVQQMGTNRAVGNQFRGMQSQMSRQSNALQQFGRDVGVAPRGFYNNYGGFYSNPR